MYVTNYERMSAKDGHLTTILPVHSAPAEEKGMGLEQQTASAQHKTTHLHCTKPKLDRCAPFKCNVSLHTILYMHSLDGKNITQITLIVLCK